jgi:hypothetical protein
MENQTLAEEKPANKNRTLIIVAAVAVVLCCCCVVTAAGGYYFYTNNKSVVVAPSLPQEDYVPETVVSADEPPSGGLANDILKNDTWQVMGPAAISLGCEQPSGSGLEIEVLQQPDAGGVWVEKWPVMCASGETYDFEVEFILDDTGATFNITLMK